MEYINQSQKETDLSKIAIEVSDEELEDILLGRK